MLPVFEDYLKNSDIAGYMAALYREADKKDIGSLRVLLYLSVRVSEVADALDYMNELFEANDDYVNVFWDILKPEIDKVPPEEIEDQYKMGAIFKSALGLADLSYEQMHPEYRTVFKLFGDRENTMLRAYLNNVGRQSLPADPEELHIEKFVDCAPKEKKDEWRGLYSRSDCSSNQESIYHDAMPYAEQGDPYAMFIVGYLLKHGIQTKYDHPRVVILEADEDRAFPWLRNAADAGIIEACPEVAEICFNRARKNNDPEAEKMGWDYTERGAEKNDVASLCRLFDYYKDKDDHKAFGFLQRLSDAHDTHRYTLELASWYEQGRGTAKDEKKAYELVNYVYTHSSASPYDGSHEDAVDILCRYLRDGIGCEVDTDRAWTIYSKFKRDEDDLYEVLTR